jgi:hypothetical protein
MADPLARLQALLTSDSEAHGLVIERLDRLLASSPEAARRLGVVPVAGEARLASARFSAELLDDQDALRARPSFEEDVAVIEWVLRPAIPYGELELAAEAGIWPGLATIDLGDVARSCCRIDIGRTWERRVHAGSGFVLRAAGEVTWLVTAAHVTTSLEAEGWGTPSGPLAWAWCGSAEPENAGDALELHGTATAHHVADLSLVRLGCQIGSAISLPDSARVRPGSLLAVCGYPYFDSRRDSWLRAYGFRDPTSTLRISPGTARRVVNKRWKSEESMELIEHDAATLSGSSGSLIIDLPELRLVGVHVGGWADNSDGPFSANVAVPQDRIVEML